MASRKPSLSRTPVVNTLQPSALATIAALFVLPLAACPGVAAALGDESPYYVHRATWQDSMLATRQAAARRQAELVKAAGPDSPWPGVSLGPWWTIPLSDKPLDRGATVTDVPFPPEQGPVDVTKPCGGLTWTQCPDLRNRKGAGYLFRVLRAAEPMAAAVTLTRGGDGTVVWLNGRKVFRFERGIPFAGSDHNLRLNLAKGDNQLLVKLTLPGAIGLKPVDLWQWDRDPTPENPLNPVWNRLLSDFPDTASRHQMRWEREDGIWDGPWADVIATPLAERYAAAAGKRCPDLAGAGGGTVETARSVYYHACRISEAERFLRQRDSLRSAIEDLIATYGPRYPKGADRLASLDALCKAIEVKGEAAAKGDVQAGAAFDQTVDACLALRHEALLANPLLDFKQLLLVKRFCSYRGIRHDNGNEPGQPVSWACHASLNTHGWDNEIAVLSPVRPDGKLTTLYRPEGTGFVGDVDLHWDADRMIFSGIREPGRWQVFEIGADGRGVREFIREQHPDVDNFDACYLPDGAIAFNSTATMQAVPCSASDRVANLYRAEADGKGIRRLCFDQDQDYMPSVANDGRILYTRWEYADVAHCFARLLFTMNPDGANQMSVYKSNSYWPPALWFARAIPNHPSKVAAIVAGHHGGRRRGQLVIFDTARGQYEADGAVHMIGKGNAPIQPVFQDSLYSGGVAFGAKGVFPCFLHPYPLSDKYLLTAGRLTANSQWAIYLVDVFGNILPVYEDPEFALYEPIPLRRTPRPPVIPDRTQRAAKDATVLLTDVYQGPGLKGVPRGTVKQLRVYSYVWGHHTMARYGAAGAIDGRRILGTVPVEPDGSAYFRVPANTPLAVQPLDAEGRALQVMRSWYTAMPGERASCIGCHERFSDTPTAGKGLAALKPPVDIQPWNGPVRPYGFAREVAPVLQRRCSGCHEAQRGKQAAAGPPAPRLDPAVLRQYMRHVGSESDYRLRQPGEHYAESSELVQMLRKGHHGVTPDREEFDRLITWIDLNTPIAGTWTEGGAKGGCSLVDRRRELDRCHAGLDVDIEAYPAPAPPPVTPILPQPEKLAEPVTCPNWPFDRAEAQRRQKAAGTATSRRIELGRTGDGNAICIDLVLVPTGEFVIGDPNGPRDERPAARVRIAGAFWMTRCEISNEVYALFDAAHDSYIYDTNPNSNPGAPGVPLNQPGQPVVRTSWREAMAFCRWLSKKTGERFTLPTEGQWEWACRAGTDTPLWFGAVDANYAGNANVADQAFAKIGKGIRLTRVFDNRFDDGGKVTVPGGKYAANAWGLHDMHGNVGEWTLSAYRPYPYAEADARNDASPDGEKVIRGGSWHDRPLRCRSAFRNYLPAWLGAYDVGFRVVAPAGAKP
jgi:formylglycine-generating enzyme required for sulfatase activity